MSRVRVSESALEFEDLRIPLTVKRNRAARRISLRIDVPRRGAILTLPARAGLSAGLDFVAEKALWLRNAYARLPEAVPFAHDAVIPLLGRPHRIEHRPLAKGGVWREGGSGSDTIIVAGAAEHLPRRLGDWLRREAQALLEAKTRAKAALVGRAVARVFVRDTRSRWGSCARDGRVHYSWRLIFAPDFVLDYVVAHEVAHLIYMSHGPRFRAVVERLTDRRAEAEAWLRVNGSGLLLLGASFG
ncbi:MAG TPA: SprT family zinc-dependent metalloprotease [Alphaproteobacteria bacterium]|jgi:predicted metal-dependent hydrolase